MIEFYLQNGKNQSLTRRHFQFNKTTLRHWIKQYNCSSINGLAVCHTKTWYTLKLKLSVIQA
ncbi:MAG: transposase, partial [[Pasteurella] aerogenes]|nr:transposase [[Pasteurella] aerogenes]